MKTELAVFRRNGRIRCVCLEDGQPVECLDEKPAEALGEGDVILGKVSRVEPRLKCAFIDIGEAENAMLPLWEAPDSIKAGQPIIIQVRRETDPGKGKKVSATISLAGPFAVFSSRGTAKRRSRLKNLGPVQARQLYEQDLMRLKTQWASLEYDGKSSGSFPRRLLDLSHPVSKSLVAFSSSALDRVVVEDQPLYAEVYSLMAQIMPIDLPQLKLFVSDDGYGLEAVLGLSDLNEQISRRKVWLPSGAHLVFDKTEALWVIDVNSGKSAKGRNAKQLKLGTNLEAADEIARQIRLRKITGAIVIDFIGLEDEADQADLINRLVQATGRDRAMVKVFGMTALGLVEMTRSPQ